MRVPKLRFREFEGEWEERRFEECFEFLRNNTFSRNDLNYENGAVKNIHYGDILTKFDNLLNSNNNEIPFINADINLKNFEEKDYLKSGDIIIADTAEDFTVGKAIEIKNVDSSKMLAGLHTFACRGKFNFALGYLGQYINSPQYHSQLYTLVTGIKVSSISKQSIKDTKLNIPSLAEQEKIGRFLSAVDKKIELTSSLLDEFKTYKKGLMQKIFTQKLRFRDDEGRNFPDWQEKRLGDITKVQGGYAFKSENFKENGIPIIRISNLSIDSFGIDKNNLVFYDEMENEDNFIINKGDLLIALSGATVGKIAVYDLDSKAYLNQRVGLFKRTTLFYYKFMVQYTKSTVFSNQLKNIIVAGAQPNISPKDIENFTIKLPSLAEQQKIADFLSSIDSKIDLLDKELEGLRAFKKSLLQQMFI